MAWSAPMTAVVGAVFTAAQFNQYVRDNFLETAVAKATSANGLIATDGLNSVKQVSPAWAYIGTAESLVNTPNYSDLATVGPTVSVATGTAAMVWFGAASSNNQDNQASLLSYEVGGASSALPSANRRVSWDGFAANNFCVGSGFFFHTGLNAGVNTFTLKYAGGSANTVTFRERKIMVVPL